MNSRGGHLRTAAANQARQQPTAAKLQRDTDALQQMRRERAPITYPAVVRRAGVSRNAEASALMTAAIAETVDRNSSDRLTGNAQLEAFWRQRALNSENALKAAYAEIGIQRERIGDLLGQLRDLEREYAEDTVQRIATENSTLKQRIRQLTQDNRNLNDKLQAARSNNRFADRRIAELEAQLLEHPATHS